MKTFIRIAAAALAVAVAAPALAQQNTTAGDGAQIGIGAGITGGGGGTVLGTGAIAFVPINIKTFRIEPFIGWERSSFDSSNNTAPLNSFDGKASDFLLGVGGFLVKPVASQVQLYAGGRVGLEWQSQKDNGNGGSKRERRNLLFAGALGGEYLPVQRVALGAELQLGLVFYGDTKITSNANGASVEGSGGWGTATQATFFARFYLF